VTHAIGCGVVAGALLASLLAPARAEGIYTCVDAKGRRLTSDRPIVECIDREQRELTPGGLLKRKIGPSLTADERAAEEEKQRKVVEERNRGLEEKRRDRALLTRYPDKVSHDKERRAALGQIDSMVESATQHTEALINERKRLDLEFEFYRSDPSKVPPKLRRQVEENVSAIEAQKRFVLAQEEEKRRINIRFDEELAKLKQLWALRVTPVASSAPPTTAAKP
jgi:hypothetical protein